MKFRIQHYRQLSSTNTLALQYAARGAAEGLVIVADYQTSGRGQFERRWISPPAKNLLFSVLLRPPVSPHKAPWLTQIACRSIADVLRKRFKVNPTYKRPNDILVRGKKICGILVEASSSSRSKLENAVVGIGLNVNANPDQLVPGATSLKCERDGKSSSRNALLMAILEQLNKDLTHLYASLT